MSALLHLRGVCRDYDRPVLRDIDLSVQQGEIVVLVGGSGCGKTTLLRIAAGLERAGAGQVALRGVLADDGGRVFVSPERRGVGMVFQDHALWPHLTAGENVALAMPRAGGRAAPARAAAALLETLGLDGYAQRRPGTLSGGQQQRVALARALATGSDLLLLDEPLSSLDGPVRERLRPLIRDAVRGHGRSALFVSHDRLDAWHLADRIAVLDEGRLVQDDLPHRLYAAPVTETVARIMGATGRLAVTGLGDGAVSAAGQVLAAASGLAPGQAGTGLAHPAAVTISPDGAGLPARLIDRVFEAGSWRGRWRTGCGELVGLHPAPPPEQAVLRLAPAQFFAFPSRPGHCLEDFA